MIYYVSNHGNDSADGKAPETAWKTIDKVNSAIMPGDEIRFRRGHIFYGAVIPKAGMDFEHPTTYTAWGDGPRPIICQYKITAPDAWEQVQPNIYRIDMADPSRYSGNVWNPDSNAGFIKVSGKIYYRKCTSLAELTEAFDFYCDNSEHYIYVYADENPALLSDDIRIACNIRCITFADNIAVIGLELCGTGGHGISGVTGGAMISDCYIHEIGGSELIGYIKPNVRYGNGVETWSNSHDVTVEHCRFADIYDVAITMQGDEVTRSWENMHFRHNTFWNCTQCLEIWSEGEDPSIGFVNCEFADNTCLFTGECWGYAARPVKSVATPLLIYQIHTHNCDVKIKNNLFADYHSALLFKSGGVRAIPAGYDISGNTILRKPGQVLFQRGHGESEEELKAFEEKITASNHVVDRTRY